MSSETTLYHRVRIHPNARISPAAGIVGDVRIGSESCVLAGAQIRGDDAPVVIGEQTSIQENAIVHVEADCPVVIGDRCTVGHGAIVHGCEIGRNTLVGMGAIIMNGAKIGEECVVAAGALVTEGKEFPPRTMIMGMPARAVRTLGDEEVERLCADAADEYVEVGAAMLREGVLVHPDPDLVIQLGASSERV